MIEFIKIKTRKFLPPKDDFYNLLDKFLPPLKNGDILIITSKVLAIHQGRCVKKEGADKDEIILKEADYYIPRDESPRHCMITIKNNVMVTGAGIDQSNANGFFVLWPEKMDELAKEIRNYLKKKYNLKNLAIIITDSQSKLLTLGAVGAPIYFLGLEPLKNYVGKKDIFGRTIKVERADVVTPLASMGVLLMGEGDEQTPMVVARGADFLEFTEKETFSKFIVPLEEDIHRPLLKAFRKSL
jgi:F420-0:gamma-glutamyl ligase